MEVEIETKLEVRVLVEMELYVMQTGVVGEEVVEPNVLKQ